ncbi:MAG: low molecular weight protein arginine phosphatase [Syntrophomonadaceae bacterium]
MRILFVCSGNTCRSPMAQALLRKALTQDRGTGLQEVEVWSAGLWAVPGQPASPEALKAMKSHGIDISQHRTRVLEASLVQEADLILAMTGSQSRQLKDLYPQKGSRIFTLTEFAGNGSIDVVDPYGAGVKVYMGTAEQLKDLIEEVVERLRLQKMAMGEQI